MSREIPDPDNSFDDLSNNFEIHSRGSSRTGAKNLANSTMDGFKANYQPLDPQNDKTYNKGLISSDDDFEETAKRADPNYIQIPSAVP